MTNYNDGAWHIWHGGECPVHPKSVVEWVIADELDRWELSSRVKVNAEDISFDAIVAFRVVKEYREPREFWIVGGYAFMSEDGAKNVFACATPIHVREVTE